MSFFKSWLEQLSPTSSHFQYTLDSKTYSPGDTIHLTISLTGGAVEQHICGIIVELNSHLTAFSNPSGELTTNLTRIELEREIYIPANEKVEKLYNINLPQFMPISNEQSASQLQVTINPHSSKGKSIQVCPLTIVATAHQNAWFECLHMLGFKQESAWNTKNDNQSYLNTNFLQKYRFRSKTLIPNKNLDLIFWMESFEDYLDVYIDISTGLFSASIQSTPLENRFTIDLKQGDLYTEHLRRFILKKINE
ncbi:sporulation protein [Catenovulum sediminis]|uniref:Sporulation protein n=1 Tax=Catenovulum sediminis TaxID=1740262 RepID=A0ABV1RHM9_9ALTE|nr:sporulation protein [Catenovulum sediminis]